MNDAIIIDKQSSCGVAALPFQAHANYGTWSIDFEGVSVRGN